MTMKNLPPKTPLSYSKIGIYRGKAKLILTICFKSKNGNLAISALLEILLIIKLYLHVSL